VNKGQINLAKGDIGFCIYIFRHVVSSRVMS